MPTYDEHISHASHNLEFLKVFYYNNKYNDWSITVAFYTVVHIVEGCIYSKYNLDYDGKQITLRHSSELLTAIDKAGLKRPENSEGMSTHKKRYLIVSNSFAGIAGSYDLLYNSSMTARYIKYQWSDDKTKRIVAPAMHHITEWANKNFKTTFNGDLVDKLKSVSASEPVSNREETKS